MNKKDVRIDFNNRHCLRNGCECGCRICSADILHGNCRSNCGGSACNK